MSFTAKIAATLRGVAEVLAPDEVEAPKVEAVAVGWKNYPGEAEPCDDPDVPETVTDLSPVRRWWPDAHVRSLMGNEFYRRQMRPDPDLLAGLWATCETTGKPAFTCACVPCRWVTTDAREVVAKYTRPLWGGITSIPPTMPLPEQIGRAATDLLVLSNCPDTGNVTAECRCDECDRIRSYADRTRITVPETAAAQAAEELLSSRCGTTGKARRDCHCFSCLAVVNAVALAAAKRRG